jgi:hypothetical protein
MTRSIPVTPPPRFTQRFLYGVAIAFCAFLSYLYFRSASGLDSARANQQLPGTLAAISIAISCVALMVWAVKRRSVELTESALTIKAGFYTRTIQRQNLRVESGFAASLFTERSISPRWRTNGIRVPGFQAGWYRLVNGDKALVLLTDPNAVTYLPTREGFSLLISTSALLPALAQSGEPTAPAG